MNVFGSYKALLGNSISSMLASIEIYNKPMFQYREECFSILLLNSWELLFKAILSKNRQRIFRKKERNQPFKTLLFYEAMDAARPYFPAGIPWHAVSENVTKLYDYRNNAIHFYNEKDFGIVIFGLAQTSIVNFRDLVLTIFQKDIADEMNISLLPLSFGATPDPITFMTCGSTSSHSPVVAEYLKVISETTKRLEDSGVDTGRFLTVFRVNFQSTKKIATADLVIGVNAESGSQLLNVERRVDPNESHPLLRKNVMAELGAAVNGRRFTTHTFDCIVKVYQIKDKPRYCWNNQSNNTFQYSRELVTYIRSLSMEQIQYALENARRI